MSIRSYPWLNSVLQRTRNSAETRLIWYARFCREDYGAIAPLPLYTLMSFSPKWLLLVCLFRQKHEVNYRFDLYT